MGVLRQSRRISHGLIPTTRDIGFAGISFANTTFWLAGPGGALLQSDAVTGAIFLSGRMLANNGGFQINVTGLGGQNFRIQQKTSLNGSDTWSDAVSITNAQVLQTWFDTSATNQGSRFYRVISP